jgi:glycosyltransferase involved in cell wall biosynthesis
MRCRRRTLVALPQSRAVVFSIVIPAFNEGAVIGRCLSSLLGAAEPGELEIIVVCNGCSDNTAEVARSFGPLVVVTETPVASKWRALNIGDALATGFPRMYVDADVTFSHTDALLVVDALKGGALAAAPGLRMETSGASWVVRSHLRIWEQLPVIRHGLMGRGVYGMSEAGRSRFGEFPDMVADDYYVHHLFNPDERVVVERATSIVQSPRRAGDLIRRKTRSYAGLAEARAEGASEKRTGSSLEWLTVVKRDPARVIDLPAYLGVSWIAKLRARRRLAPGETPVWDRDQSTRGSSA